MTPHALSGKRVTAALLIALLGAQPAIHAQAISLCQADALKLGVDDGDGRFNGMSQSGMVLTVRHDGHAACSLPARPEIEFQDAHHQALSVSARRPPGMHPGPVILPIQLPAQASASSEVRWVSGDVYDHGQCVTPDYVALHIGTSMISAPFKGQLCGPSDTGPTYRATLFKLVDKQADSAP